MRTDIIGRKEEQEVLNSLYISGRAEFAVIYGRRRVGKTFLVREYFEGEMSFYHTALSPFELAGNGDLLMQQQLQSFHSSLREYGDYHTECPKNWIEAFDWLRDLLKRSRKRRLVVFIDELPWLDTPRSGFIPAFEHFWNGWGAGCKRLFLVVCGSATSWISDQLLNNTGGLYGRTTREICLAPFSLSETEMYLAKNNFTYTRYDILELYMVMGGIPYYLSYLNRGRSVAQNIDDLFFKKGSKLETEFARLFSSLFIDSDKYISVMRLLSTRRKGYTRKEIADRLSIQSGGGLTQILRTLLASNFVVSYNYYNQSVRDTYYKLADFFTLFYFYFIDGKDSLDPKFWQTNNMSAQLNSWRGFSFEEICFTHYEKIKHALGISGVHTEISSWASRNLDSNAQIDMVIDRDDRVIDLCEMKFYSSDFVIDKSYDADLRNKVTVFINETKCRKSPQLVLVTTYGLKANAYSGRIQNVVTMDDLF